MQENGREVFISYHTDSEYEMVVKICDALEANGISCWYAPRNVEAAYAGSIVRAIAHCKVFLLLLNKNVSEHIKNEVCCAFDRYNRHEDITLLPFRVDDCELDDDIRYYLARFHIVDGTVPPEDARIRELKERISWILGHETVKSATAPDGYGRYSANAGQTFYQLIGSMIYPDNQFVGREQDLNQIHRQLSAVENKLFLVGMGGIGKSEIAKMYCKKYAAEYDVILWIPFEGSLMETIANDASLPIRGISRDRFPEEDVRGYFEQKLQVLKEISDRRVLLVVDNFDVSGDPDLESFCAGSYSVLFTSRCHQTADNIPEMEISAITDEKELLELFFSKYTRALDADGKETVKKIIHRLGGHTLSVRLVGSTMQSRRISPDKMLQLLENGVWHMAEQNAKAESMIFGTLRQVFRLSAMSVDEKNLLKNLSLFPLQGVSVEQFYEWYELDDFDVIDGLIRQNWVIHNPVTDEVHLHPLVAELLGESYYEDPDFCERLLTNFEKELITGYKFVKLDLKWRQMLGEYSASFLQRLPGEHPMYVRALRIRGLMAYNLSRQEEAVSCYQKLLSRTDNLKERVFLYGRLAHCQAIAGDAKGSLDTAMEGLAMVADVPAKEFYSRFGYHKNWIQMRVVEALRMVGDYDLSVEYGREALAIETEEYPSQTSVQEGRGWALYHLAAGLRMRGNSGDNEEAWHLLDEAIALFGEVEDEWSKSFCYSEMAQILLSWGKPEEALQYNRKAEEILRQMQGKKHQNVGENLLARGTIYRAMGENDKAESCFLEAVGIFHGVGLLKREAAAREQLFAKQQPGGISAPAVIVCCNDECPSRACRLR